MGSGLSCPCATHGAALLIAQTVVISGFAVISFLCVHAHRYHTGDIAALGPGRRITVLGRCVEMIKLSNGLFTSPSRLEAVFAEAAAVARAFVHGDAAHAHVVAVVVPADDAVGEAEVLRQLRVAATMHGLAAYEAPVRALVERADMQWTAENGLLTVTGKLNRAGLTNRYKARLEALLDAPETPVPPPTDEPATETAEDWVVRLAADTVGPAAAAVPTDDARCRTFQELGGTSTAAVRFLLRLRARYPSVASVSAARLLHQPLRDVAAVCATEPTSATAGAWRASDHAATWEAMDALCALPGAGGGLGPVPPPPAAPSATDLLLTGATGFVGAHVLAALMEVDWGARGRSVWCLVRAADDAAAARRVRAALQRYGLRSECQEWVRGVATPSLSDPLMGLPPDMYAALGSHVTCVLHLAASVTMWEDFARAQSNVASVRQVLLFCREHGAVLHHASTLSVFGGWQSDTEGGPLTERASIGSDARHSGVAFADGYSQSKWVGEKLVAAAAEQWGLSVVVHRLGFMSWSRATGACNPEDWLTRLLRAALRVGAWPDCGCLLQLAPVDWAAGVLVGFLDAGVLPAVTHVFNSAPTPLALLVRGAPAPLVACTLSGFCARVEADGEANPAFSLLPQLRGGLPAGSAVAPPGHGVGPAPVVDAALLRVLYGWVQGTP